MDQAHTLTLPPGAMSDAPTNFEGQIARHLARHALIVAPVVIAAAAVFRGVDGAISAAIGLVIVSVNFLARGRHPLVGGEEGSRRDLRRHPRWLRRSPRRHRRHRARARVGVVRRHSRARAHHRGHPHRPAVVGDPVRQPHARRSRSEARCRRPQPRTRSRRASRVRSLRVPPIDELFRWKDIVFKDTPFAINKTSLLVLISSVADPDHLHRRPRKMKLVPSGMQNVVESTYEFVDKGITRDVIGNDATRFTPFLGVALPLRSSSCNFWESHPRASSSRRRRASPSRCFLALMVYVLYWFVGFKHQGLKYLTGHLFPPGVPKPLYILVTPDRVRADRCSCGPSRWRSDSSPT